MLMVDREGPYSAFKRRVETPHGDKRLMGTTQQAGECVHEGRRLDVYVITRPASCGGKEAGLPSPSPPSLSSNLNLFRCI